MGFHELCLWLRGVHPFITWREDPGVDEDHFQRGWSKDQPSKSTGRLPSVPDNLLLKRAIHRRYGSTYRSLGPFQGNHAFHTTLFFGQQNHPVCSVACDQRSAWMGFLANQSCWLMRARYWTIFVKFFSIKLSADVLFLRKVSLEAAISLWIFNWRLNKFFLSGILTIYRLRPKSGVSQDLLWKC